MNTATTEFWALFTGRLRYGRWELCGIPKVSKRKPQKTRANQVAMKISVEIPTTYFSLPTLSAKVVLPDNAPSRSEILAAVKSSVAEHAKEKFSVEIGFEEAPQ